MHGHFQVAVLPGMIDSRVYTTKKVARTFKRFIMVDDTKPLGTGNKEFEDIVVLSDKERFYELEKPG